MNRLTTHLKLNSQKNSKNIFLILGALLFILMMLFSLFFMYDNIFPFASGKNSVTSDAGFLLDLTPRYVGLTGGKFITPITPPDVESIPISNREQLAAIDRTRQEAEEGPDHLKDYHLDGIYHLVNDIYLSDAEWVPIGDNAPLEGLDGINGFRGSFDGQGYVIHDLVITSTAYEVAGLFGSVSGAQIKNVGLEDVNINISLKQIYVDYYTDLRMGGICGAAYETIIDNCYATGSVSVEATSDFSFSYVGGICGDADWMSTLSNCYSTCAVYACSPYSFYLYSDSGYSSAGGICGRAYGELNNCFNTGTIVSTTLAGGICGDNRCGLISNCYNSGFISASYSAGGICGVFSKNYYFDVVCSIHNCYNEGVVFSSADDVVSSSDDIEWSYYVCCVLYSGGIYGYGGGGDVYDCYNMGSVSASAVSVASEAYVGGICGVGDGTIRNCYNIGDISVESEYDFEFKYDYEVSYDSMIRVGGICGEAGNIDINDCYNVGSVSASAVSEYSVANAGGISGVAYWGSFINNCYNNGAIFTSAGDIYTGGLIGFGYGGTVVDCYATGDVTATGSSESFAGGLVGYNDNYGTMQNCYATGDVTATGSSVYVGGLVGYSCYEGVWNCYATGDVTATGSSEFFAGGLIGNNSYYTVWNCYATGDVTATGSYYMSFAGGLIGCNGGTAVDCYATGDVTATSSSESFAGGLIGYRAGEGNVYRCYRLSSQIIIGDMIDDVGVPLTSEEMQNKQSFVDWDFDEIWAISSKINERYPYLRSLITSYGEVPRDLSIREHSKNVEISEGSKAVIFLDSPAHSALMEAGIRYNVKVWEYTGSQKIADYTDTPIWTNVEQQQSGASVNIDASTFSLANTADGIAKYFVYVYFDDGTSIEGDTAILTVIPRLLYVVFDNYAVYNDATVKSVPISWTATGSGNIEISVKVNGVELQVNPNGRSVTVEIDSSESNIQKEYVVNVTATNQYGGFYTSSATFYVYNNNALTNAFGSLIVIDNTHKVVGKTNAELLNIRDDLTLVHSIQLDSNIFAWSETDDKLTWQIDNDAIANVYYLDVSGWVKAVPNLALSPFTPIRVIGNQNGQTTLTVTHAKTGMSLNVPVSVTTLKDQLYCIKTAPGQAAVLTYTNGNNEPKVLDTSITSVYGARGAFGEVAIYEPKGIASDISIQSTVGDDKWIGTIKQTALVSGETSGQYPMNNIKLTLLSNIVLYAVEPSGNRYQGEVQITGGLFINDMYVLSSQITSQKYNSHTDGTGRIFLQLNTDSFGVINARDTYRYVFEIRFLSGNYAPMIIEIDALYDSREALQSNIFTLRLRSWDRTNPVTYLYNGVDVTQEKGTIGLTDENPTGMLIARAVLPDNKPLTKAQIIGIDNSIVTGQSFTVIDKLPFLTDITYVDIRWDLNKNTIPVGGASRSFNVIFTYADGTSRTEKMPFAISNTVGMKAKADEASYLVIPVSAQVMTTNALGTARNVPLFPRPLPVVSLNVKELDFNVAIEATVDPEIYKLYGYVGGSNFVVSNPIISVQKYATEPSFWNEYTAIKNDILLQNLQVGGFSLVYKPSNSLEFEASHSLTNLEAYVEGYLKWNPEKNNFDLIITDGDMIGGVSVSFSVSYSFPIIPQVGLHGSVGVETGISNEFSMAVYKTNEIMVTNEFVIYDKLFGGPNIDWVLLKGGVDVYAKNSWNLEYGSRYDVDSRTARQASRYSKSVSAGVEGWGWAGLDIKIWTFWKTYYVRVTLVSFRDTLWSDHQVLYSINLDGDTSIWNNRGVTSLSTPVSLFNEIDMNSYNDGFLLPQGMGSLTQPVLFSSIPTYPENDLGAVIAGDNTFAAASWVSLNPRVSADYLDALEGVDEISSSELISFANQFEISVSVYDGTIWSDPPLMLTDNHLSDSSPVVAVDSVNNRAVVVWQRLMLHDDGADGLYATTELWYSVYDNGVWSTPSRLDYMGDSWLAEYQVAMNSAGFAVTVGTSDEDTGDVTAYFVDWSDNITKTALTNRNALNVNPQIVASQNGFYLSYYSYSEDGNDIVVKKMSNDGTVDNQATLSVNAVSGVSVLNPTMAYLLIGSDDNQAAIICRAYDFTVQGDAIYALKITESGGKLSMSAPMTVVKPQSGYWLEITGGELNGNSIIVEYAEMQESDGSIDPDDIMICTTPPIPFENTILCGHWFNNLDVMVNNDLVVTFGVANTGMDIINSVVITVDGKTYVTSNDLIQPGAISAFDVTLPVGASLKDFSYTISVVFTNGDTNSYTDTLALAKPDVSIGKITTLVVEKGQREFSINLFNDGYIPLSSTGYEVRLSFFEDPKCTIPATGVIGQTSITSLEDLTLIDEGGLNLHYRYTIPASLLEDGEIPYLGAWLYVRAEIWNGNTFVEQHNYLANQIAFGMNSLIRYGEPTVVITADTELGTTGTIAHLHIINRSMQPLNVDAGTIKTLLHDVDGNVIETQFVKLTNSLSAEDTTTQSIQFSKNGAYVLAVFVDDSSIVTLSGVVKYPSSIIPATVSLYDSDLNFVASTETALDGSYVLSAPEGTGYILKVTKPGYLSYTIKNLSFTDDQSIGVVDLSVLGGDVNGDGVVDGTDLTLFLSAYGVGVASAEFPFVDLNGDGVVDATDLTIFLAGYNKINIIIG